ncbi:Uncharacterised protein [Candidatus Norongarragalina meridionalis]|nr:Uncharacterised protein [Candidatus Norongarragalina meridionalis]
MRRILAFVLVAVMLVPIVAAVQAPFKNIFVFDGSSQRVQKLSDVTGAPSSGPTESSHSVKFATPVDMTVAYMEKGKCYYAKFTSVYSIDFTREVEFYLQENPVYDPYGVAQSLFDDLSSASGALLDYSGAKMTVLTRNKQQFIPYENPFCERPAFYYSYTIDSLKYLKVLTPNVLLSMCPGNSCYFNSSVPATLKLQRDSSGDATPTPSPSSGGQALQPIDMTGVWQITIDGAGGAALIQQLYTASEDASHRRTFTYAIDSAKFTATINTLTKQTALENYLKYSTAPPETPSGTQNPVKQTLVQTITATGFSYSGGMPSVMWDVQSSLMFSHVVDISFTVGGKQKLVRGVTMMEFPEGSVAAAAVQKAIDGLKSGTDDKRSASFPSTALTVYSEPASSSCVTPSDSPHVEIAMTVTTSGESVSVTASDLPNKDASGKTISVPVEVSFERSPGALTNDDMVGILAVIGTADINIDIGKPQTKSVYSRAEAELYDGVGLRATNIKRSPKISAFMPSVRESRGTSYVDGGVLGQCKLPVKRESLVMSAVTKSSSVSLRFASGIVKDFFALPGPYKVRVIAAGQQIGEQTIYLNSPDPTEAVADAVRAVGLPVGTKLPVQYLAKGASTAISYGSLKSLPLTRSGDNYAIGAAGLTQKVPLGEVFAQAANMVALAEPVCYTGFVAPSCTCKGNDACTPVWVQPKTS